VSRFSKKQEVTKARGKTQDCVKISGEKVEGEKGTNWQNEEKRTVCLNSMDWKTVGQETYV